MTGSEWVVEWLSLLVLALAGWIVTNLWQEWMEWIYGDDATKSRVDDYNGGGCLEFDVLNGRVCGLIACFVSRKVGRSEVARSK